jgi:hypothetical protein
VDSQANLFSHQSNALQIRTLQSHTNSTHPFKVWQEKRLQTSGKKIQRLDSTMQSIQHPEALKQPQKDHKTLHQKETPHSFKQHVSRPNDANSTKHCATSRT